MNKKKDITAVVCIALAVSQSGLGEEFVDFGVEPFGDEVYMPDGLMDFNKAVLRNAHTDLDYRLPTASC